MKSKLQIFRYPLVILFLVMIFLPAFNGLFGFWEFERKDENRTFRDTLKFDVTNLDIFPQDAEDYINDNFAFRSPLLDVFHHIKFYYFKMSPHPEKTVIGTDGWYFMAAKEKDIFEGRLKFSDKDLEKFNRVWAQRKEYLEGSGIKYYWVICPIKHYVYTERLPFYVSSKKDTRRVDVLESYLNDHYPGLIIDPLPELLEAKKNGKLYYKLDNHWNLKAGQIVSDIVIKRIREDFPGNTVSSLPQYTWSDTLIQGGIHYRTLGVESLHEIDYHPEIMGAGVKDHPKYGFKSPEGFPYPWEYEFRYKKDDDPAGLRVLIIRDSFGNQVMNFLKESFAETVFIFDAWQYDLNEPIVEAVKPDVVVFISLETHIGNLID